jgi:hypothetical protein
MSQCEGAFSPCRAMHSPTSVQSHFFIGALVFTETHRRILKGEFGRIPRPISDDAFSMGGYCIDAHEIIPAGSVEFDSFGPGPDDWVASPTTTNREAP